MERKYEERLPEKSSLATKTTGLALAVVLAAGALSTGCVYEPHGGHHPGVIPHGPAQYGHPHR